MHTLVHEPAGKTEMLFGSTFVTVKHRDRRYLHVIAAISLIL